LGWKPSASCRPFGRATCGSNWKRVEKQVKLEGVSVTPRGYLGGRWQGIKNEKGQKRPFTPSGKVIWGKKFKSSEAKRSPEGQKNCSLGIILT